tara:strand:- start:144 stop:371 length:228 start_codon:yes stop_codon:yes gene_type:complete
MSFDIIKEKIMKSLKDELYNEENKEFMENEILKPLIQKILDELYPYYAGVGLLFISMFLFIMIILMINMRLYLYK